MLCVWSLYCWQLRSSVSRSGWVEVTSLCLSGHSLHQLGLLLWHGVEVLVLLLALAQETGQGPVRVRSLGLVQFCAAARTMVDLGLPGPEELGPHVAPGPGLDHLHHGEDGEGGEGQQGQQPAEGVTPGRILVLAVIVGRGPVVQNSEHPDYKNETRGGVLPRKHEECRGLPACHIRNILGQSWGSIAPLQIMIKIIETRISKHPPDYCNCLEEGDVHERDGGWVVINDMESVDTTLGIWNSI